MVRAIGGIIIVFVVMYALFIFFEERRERLAFPEEKSEEIVLPIFEETGTLVFYPNNVGPVPYIFYTDARGGLNAKALTFVELPPHDFSNWTAGRVSVVGRLEREHVVVSRITYLAQP
ncbi:hypothetical protein HYV30_00715 [Candidatus Kaiserbacteria bacterium]|nr:hypothetical protein [Candidatus Kaiserbacteria bacterium]